MVVLYWTLHPHGTTCHPRAPPALRPGTSLGMPEATSEAALYLQCDFNVSAWVQRVQRFNQHGPTVWRRWLPRVWGNHARPKALTNDHDFFACKYGALWGYIVKYFKLKPALGCLRLSHFVRSSDVPGWNDTMLTENTNHHFQHVSSLIWLKYRLHRKRCAAIRCLSYRAVAASERR